MSHSHADRLRRLRWAEDAVDFLLDRLGRRLEELAETRAALDRDIDAFSRAGGVPVQGWGHWTELCQQRRDLFSQQCVLRRGYLDLQDRKRYLQERIRRVEGLAGPRIGRPAERRDRWRRFLLDPVHLTGEEPALPPPALTAVMPARSGRRRI